MGTPRGHRAPDSHSYASLERTAASIRKELGFAATDPLPGLDLFERLDSFAVRVGRQRIPLNYGVVPDLPHGVDARTRYDVPSGWILVELPENGYRALIREQPHVRFSLFHEIAHAILHPVTLLRFSVMPQVHVALLRGEHTGHAPCEDTEWQADALSAALLMPAVGLLAMEKAGTLDAESIAQEFSVSFTAATIRLRNFKERREDLLRRLT
jgi:hypothetical protein